MPTIKNKRQMADEAEALALSFFCEFYKEVLYLPADYLTGEWSTPPPPERRMWRPMDKTLLMQVARTQFGTVFSSDTDVEQFRFMVQQASNVTQVTSASLLLTTDDGLRVLREDGELYVPDGSFVPNIIPVRLNTDSAAKEEVLSVITEWLGSEQEALSLLRHLATGLAPGWSAVKYVLLLGDGRNGKSVMMQMMMNLFGRYNVSGVSRQNISEGSPVVAELNGKLLNIIYDGVAVYLKDSGHEKSLVAGEEVGVRMLYRSSLTPVQTNALFIEGLNREPKSSDKSSALQERLVRFWFKNTYDDDLVFRERMLSEQLLGALLSLLLDNYVRKEDKAVMLSPTEESKLLKLEHMTSNSLAMQYIEHLVETGHPEDLIGKSLTDLTDEFRRWRLKDGDLTVWTKDGVRTQFKTVLEFKRKSARAGTKVIKVVVVDAFKKHALELVEGLSEEEETKDVLVGE
jgi:phage/plasmid-associated DNA primase